MQKSEKRRKERMKKLVDNEMKYARFDKKKMKLSLKNYWVITLRTIVTYVKILHRLSIYHKTPVALEKEPLMFAFNFPEKIRNQNDYNCG